MRQCGYDRIREKQAALTIEEDSGNVDFTTNVDVDWTLKDLNCGLGLKLDTHDHKRDHEQRGGSNENRLLKPELPKLHKICGKRSQTRPRHDMRTKTVKVPEAA